MELDHNDIKYITPSKELKEQFYEMKNESYDINEDVSLYGLDDANKYLQLKERPEYIPCSPYWMLDTKHNRLLGSLTIRHHLRNSDDKNGHVFLIIRPSERNKGYGKAAIDFAVNECREIGIQEPLLETYADNSAVINALNKTNCILLKEYEEYGQLKRTYTKK